MKSKSQYQIGALKATYSIVAADPSTKQVGAAVQSKYFAVGNVVPWVRSGVGAVATQARGLARYGPELLDALAAGENPQTALDTALSTDSLAPHRQIGIVTADGEPANFTGAECMEWAGSRSGPGFSIQGNILAGEEVVESMANAYVATSGSLAERLMCTLEAGQEAGGDKRGQQSAAIQVEQFGYKDIGIEGIDRLVDLRIDDHPEPIKELRRLLGLWQITEASEQAFLKYEDGDYSSASAILKEADSRFPGTPRILYNLACFLCLSGIPDESINYLKQAIKLESSWKNFAKDDSDFESIRENKDFIEIISG